MTDSDSFSTVSDYQKEEDSKTLNYKQPYISFNDLCSALIYEDEVDVFQLLSIVICSILKTEGLDEAFNLVKFIDLNVADYRFSKMCLDYFKIQEHADHEEIEDHSITSVLEKCEVIREKTPLHQEEVDKIVSEIHSRLKELKRIEKSEILLKQLSEEVNNQ